MVTPGSSVISVSRTSKLRHDLNISTPSSLNMGFRSSNNPSERSFDNNSTNRSVYQNLQAKIDKSRLHNIITQTPNLRKLNTSKFISEPPKTHENFTDITKINLR